MKNKAISSQKHDARDLFPELRERHGDSMCQLEIAHKRHRRFFISPSEEHDSAGSGFVRGAAVFGTILNAIDLVFPCIR
jgi:hypothetical protein